MIPTAAEFFLITSHSFQLHSFFPTKSTANTNKYCMTVFVVVQINICWYSRKHLVANATKHFGVVVGHVCTGGCHFEDHVTHPSQDSNTASDWSVCFDTIKHKQTKGHLQTPSNAVCLLVYTSKLFFYK